jgi:ATP-dependent RNA helicase RhlE
MPFSTMGLSPKILKAINDAGYTEPTPIQTKAVPEVLAGHDVVGVAQTGTGKTAAFVWPILQRLDARPPAAGRRGVATLIVAPTRELVVQIEENIRAYSRYLQLRSVTVYGGVGERPQIDALRRGADIVVATPGRLLDLMRSGYVRFDSLEVAVLDEADRMLDMGFLPDIRRIIAALPAKRQTLLFSATFSPEIEKIAQEFLRHPRKLEVGRQRNPAESVAQFVYEVSKDSKMTLLTELLRDEKMQMVLVFSRTKHGADKIAKKLQQSGVATATLHSNRSQGQRMEALRGFKSGAYRVLVATDIAARGIDVDGISHVVNYDFPPQPEDYVHRIGRTGRAHAIGDAISFVSSDDLINLRALERFIGRGVPRKRLADLPGGSTILSYRPEPVSEKTGYGRPSFRGSAPGSGRPGPSASRPRSNDARGPRSSSSRPASSARPSQSSSGARRPSAAAPSGSGSFPSRRGR